MYSCEARASIITLRPTFRTPEATPQELRAAKSPSLDRVSTTPLSVLKVLLNLEVLPSVEVSHTYPVNLSIKPASSCFSNTTSSSAISRCFLYAVSLHSNVSGAQKVTGDERQPICIDMIEPFVSQFPILVSMPFSIARTAPRFGLKPSSTSKRMLSSAFTQTPSIRSSAAAIPGIISNKTSSIRNI